MSQTEYAPHAGGPERSEARHSPRYFGKLLGVQRAARTIDAIFRRPSRVL